MKLKKGFVLHTSGSENLMVAVGKATREFSGMVRSNETAQFLLKHMEKEVTEEQLTEALMREYDVDRSTAARDVHRFAEKMQKEGFLED